MPRPELITQARRISPELARYINEVAEGGLMFREPYPLDHSRYNHVHLGGFERWVARDSRVNLNFRCQAVNFIISRWKHRLQGYHHWQRRGFTFYLYSDWAPTLTVVARTDEYLMFDDSCTFLPTIREILRPYADPDAHRTWAYWSYVSGSDPIREILKAVEDNHGSISTPTANALGISVGALRTEIEGLDLEEQVNAIRKRYHRRPARFRTWREKIDALVQNIRVYREHYAR